MPTLGHFADEVETLIAASVSAIQAALAGLGPVEFEAVGVWPDDEDEQLAPTYLSAGVLADREPTPGDDAYTVFRRAWNPGEFSYDAVPLFAGGPPLGEAQQRAIFEHLEAQAVYEPSRWVCDEVAQRFAAQPDVPRADTFRVFTVDENFADELLASIRHANPPSTQQRLEAEGLLPRDVRDLLRQRS